MKNLLIIMTSALLVTACASSGWGDRSESEIEEWRKAGVEVVDVGKYVKEEMSARDVLEWKNIGFTKAKEIIEWRHNNFDASEAKEWKDKGFMVLEAASWKSNNFNLKEATNWKDAGFSLKKAKEDRAQGLIPNI